MHAKRSNRSSETHAFERSCIPLLREVMVLRARCLRVFSRRTGLASILAEFLVILLQLHGRW